ncbi:MAG: hypothetical protein J6Q52_00810 [Clostridia bacterium]|nr:hypothetical protein [Clostridia bacterium]
MNNSVKILVAGLLIGMLAGAVITESNDSVRKLVNRGREMIDTKMRKLANK